MTSALIQIIKQTHFSSLGQNTENYHIFTPELLNSKNQRRTCISTNYNFETEWYQVEKYEGHYFCKFCADNYFSKEQVTRCIPTKIIKNCSTVTTEFYEHPYNQRYMKFDGLEYNINIIDPINNDNFKPVMIPHDKFPYSSEGKGMFLLPTNSFWELNIRINPKSFLWDSKNWLKVISAKFRNGKAVKVCDKNGNENFHTPCKDNMGKPLTITINSYDIGKKFFFRCPSSLEEVHDLQALDNLASNILLLEVGIYEMIDITPIPDTVQMRSSGQTRCGGNYKGGHNFAVAGNTHNVSTVRLNKIPKLIRRVKTVIQLINNEPEDELIHFTKLLYNSTGNSPTTSTIYRSSGNTDQVITTGDFNIDGLV
uniref:Uncharacterized protein n=1 Tax=Megaviridae environmental sample TaxID=1737588 RepID=A0A5J6VKN0_9VIRU|nr:MAG: hypothetical protein [Megaviridae environmental sample]